MAKVTFNPAVGHLHGHVGKLVFKERNGQDIVAEKPDQVNQPNTPAQMAQRQQFRQGALYAKGVMANAQAKAPYAAKAKAVHKPVFALAVADYLTPPVVEQIDLTGYHKHIGDAILIKAHDDMGVTSVAVTIVDNTQTPVESGTATFDATVDAWRYVATVDATAKTGLTVTANAQDHPGNTGTLSATA